MRGLATPAGDIPATGRSVTLQFVDVYEFADGTVHSQHLYFDTGALMAQLGLGSMPASASAE